MAVMYPKTIYPRTTRGEKMVYEAMRLLPEDWVVFHNREIEYQIGEQHIHYEADFVVLVPQQGVLVVEVKDWSFVRIVDGEWEFRGHTEGEPWQRFTKKSPLNQANEAGRKLFKTLRHCGILPKKDAACPKLRCMAVLTHAVPTELQQTVRQDGDISLRTGLPFDSLYVCGKKALQENLTGRILTLFRGDQKERGCHMTDIMMQRLTRYLAPSAVLHLDLAAYLTAMEHASDRLLSWLPALEDSVGDIRVDGCAGSGKTVMACHEAARLATMLPAGEERRVLMLCYNLHLADYLREQPELSALSDRITICNFHTFCTEHLLRAHGHGHILPPDTPNPLTPEVMDYLRTLLPELPHYDYILVDEAQDFHREWWDIIRALKQENGRLFLFVDEHQDIYHRREALPTPAVRLKLRDNLRNAMEIADYTAAMLPDSPATPLLLHGAAVETAEPSDDPQVRAETVRRFIAQLKENAAIEVPDSEIAVLSPWKSLKRGCSLPLVGGLLTGAAQETTEEKHARYLRWRSRENPAILGETIKAFKGLEASYVIVTDIPGEDESEFFTLADFYTACSRAKYGLFLVPTLRGAELVRRYLPHQNTPA